MTKWIPYCGDTPDQLILEWLQGHCRLRDRGWEGHEIEIILKGLVDLHQYFLPLLIQCRRRRKHERGRHSVTANSLSRLVPVDIDFHTLS